MTELEYNGFWDKAFEPFNRQLLANSKNVYFIKNKQKEIYFNYETIKASIKANEMCNPNGKLDRHKIASILAYAVIQALPFQLNYSPDVKFTPFEYYSNEYFAFHFALSIVYSFIVQDNKEKNDKETLTIFTNYSTHFDFPKCDHQAYSNSIIQILHKSKNSKCFDYFMFSNILFLIECYTLANRKSEKITS